MLLCLSLFLAPHVLLGSASTPNPGLTYYYPAPYAPVADVDADIVVYGGASGGVIAAVQAARMGKSVVLVVFGRHLGGITSGGLTNTDGVNAAVQGGLTSEFFNRVGLTIDFSPTTGAESQFEAMIANPAPYQSGLTLPPIPVYYEQRLASVQMNGQRIESITMENGSIYRGKMFIDATYEGDLMANAGVTYTIGREANAQYSETWDGIGAPSAVPGNIDPYVTPGTASSGLIFGVTNQLPGTVGTGDSRLQAYNFRIHFSNAANRRPIPMPSGYNASMFELVYRYIHNGGDASMTLKADTNNHEVFGGNISTDHIGFSDSWPEADYAAREQIFQNHVNWDMGFFYYLKNDSRFASLAADMTVSQTVRNNAQAVLSKMAAYGVTGTQFPETNGWPHELYVREARRMISDYVLTQKHFNRTIVAAVPVGLANYGSDSHATRRFVQNGVVAIEYGAGSSTGTATPWQISWRSIIPRVGEAENLLVPWAISATHVAFDSMRMEPCFMVLSQSAATAAALAIDRDQAVQDLPYSLLKLHLLGGGQIIASNTTANNGTIVDNTSVSGFSTTGTWSASTSIAGYYGSNYLHDGNTGNTASKSATFSPSLSLAGNYDVQVRWTSGTNRASNVPIDVIDNSGTTTLLVDQTTNGGIWNWIGRYNFNAGSTGSVVIRNTGANGFVVADAVNFVPASSLNTVQVIASNPSAKEDPGTPAVLQFIRDTDATAAPLTVHFQINGSAVAGVDYQALSTQVTIPSGARAVSLAVIPIPDSIAEGTRTLTVTIAPDAAYSIGTQNSATASILDKPYDDWRYRQFAATGQQNSGASAPEADPVHDGLQNQFKFLFGMDPLVSSTNRRPQLSVSSNEAAYEYWQCAQAAGLHAKAQCSEDLIAWHDFPAPPQTVSFDPVTGDRLLHCGLTLNGQTRYFFRIKIP